MAVPDPEMDEMRIMVYESRRRSSRVRQTIPHRNDFIDVLCCMDHLPGLPDKWCPAEVLHVTGAIGQGCLASGVILYLPDDNWNEQIHNVVFLENNKLRRTDDDLNSGQDVDTGDFPTLEWKFTRRQEHGIEGSDHEWLPQREQAPNGEYRNEHIMESQGKEVVAIREGHASLAVEVQKLKRELASLSSQFKSHARSREQTIFSSGAICVLSRLRYKLTAKAQMCLTPSQTLSTKKNPSDSDISVHTADGLHVGAMKIKVECSLHQFEEIARMIQSQAGPNSVWFFPEFAFTQLPLKSSAAFRILFSTFKVLATHMEITSKADRLELIRKCGSGPLGDILRMMGTISYDINDATKPSYLLPGASWGNHFEIQNCNSQEIEAAQLHPVLTRKSREWNAVDKLFVHSVALDNAPLPRLGPNTSDHQAFQLQWRRAPDLSSRSWSRGLVDVPHVHGLLELTMPFVQTQGKHLCTEIGGLASDDVLEKIV